MNEPPFNTPKILDPSGKPARPAEIQHPRCPRCHSSRRRLSGGFGDTHDVCADCGHDFLGERTADE